MKQKFIDLSGICICLAAIGITLLYADQIREKDWVLTTAGIGLILFIFLIIIQGLCRISLCFLFVRIGKEQFGSGLIMAELITLIRQKMSFIIIHIIMRTINALIFLLSGRWLKIRNMTSGCVQTVEG